MTSKRGRSVNTTGDWVVVVCETIHLRIDVNPRCVVKISIPCNRECYLNHIATRHQRAIMADLLVSVISTISHEVRTEVNDVTTGGVLVQLTFSVWCVTVFHFPRKT